GLERNAMTSCCSSPVIALDPSCRLAYAAKRLNYDRRTKESSAMRSYVLIAAGLLALSICAGPALAQQVSKEPVPGITNLSRLETTIACAGAIKADVAVPEIKKMGFVSIINLRESTEPGADVEHEEAIAKAAGLRYFHVPFNGVSPDPKAADQFLSAITARGAEPAFIHCSGRNRAAPMLLVK